ncbi:MAG: M16 family metallopeptidase [Gemmatimonadales bacterium]
MTAASQFRRATTWAAALMVVIAAPLPGQDAAAPIPLDPAVVTGVLPNGLTYYIRQNGRPVNRAELRLVIRAGSVLETDSQLGLAHYVEHMAFNGTRHFEKQALIRYLESIGMRFGADLNAYTSFDETVYLLQVPTDSAPVVRTAFQILEDWAHGIRFEQEEVERERGVVIEEWRSRRGADQRIQDAQWPAIFGESRYATRLPIGTLESLQRADSASLVRFYQDWYRPDLMAVVAVGDFDPAAIEALIREHFGRLAQPASPTVRPAFPVEPASAPRTAIATDPEAQTTSVGILTLLPVQVSRTVGEWRQSLVNQIVARALNSRYGELAQQADPPFLGAGGGRTPLVATADAWALSAVVPEGGAVRGMEALLVEAERLRRHGLTPGELDRARADMLRGVERMHTERAQRQHAEFAGAYVNHFLLGHSAPSIEWRYQVTQQLLPVISLDEVNTAAREQVLPGTPVVLVGAPEKPDRAPPEAAELLALFAAVRATELAAYTEAVDDAPLVAVPPTGGHIVREVVDTALGIHDWTLSNGARVLVKPTAFRDDQVLMTAFSLGGLSRSDTPERLSHQFAAVVPMQGGVGRFSATDLQKVLAGSTAEITPSIGMIDQGFSGSVAPDDLEEFFQLLWLYSTEPRADTTAFQAFAGQVRAFIENRGTSPEAAFQDTLQVVLGQHHPLSLPITADRLPELDLGEAIAFYRDRFANAAGMTFLFVGRVDPETLRPLVARWIGGLPGDSHAGGWRDLGIHRPDGVVERQVYRGIEPRSQTSIIFHGPIAYTRAERFALDAVREVLTVRLRDALREALGGTYGVSVGASTSRYPREEYSFTIQYGADPARVDSLAGVVFEEIERLKQDGAAADEVARITETRLREREVAMRENRFWLTLLEATAREGESVAAALAQQERLIRALAPEGVRDAARRYLNPARHVRVTLYPESSRPEE